jgi:hypothetical protein
MIKECQVNKPNITLLLFFSHPFARHGALSTGARP